MLYFQHQPNAFGLTPDVLSQENDCYCDTPGVSRNNRCHGFQPAFLDRSTGRVYLSRFADGAPAPIHLLDGLPEELAPRRNNQGCVIAVKDSVIAGFVHAERFYTREQAACALADS